MAKIMKGLFRDEFSLVYKLQKGVIKRGGKIDRYSDLIAAFERRSLVPAFDAKIALSNMSMGTGRAKFKDLISCQRVAYGRIAPVSDKTTLWDQIRVDIDAKLGRDQKYFLDSKQDILRSNVLLRDNEFFHEISGVKYIITVSPKYTGILRLINNNILIPKNYLMKRRNSAIIGISIILGSLILGFAYVYSNRYYVHSPIIIDKWTGKFIGIEEKK